MKTDWSNDFLIRYLRNENTSTRQQLTNFLANLDVFEFGLFEKFISFQQENLTRFDFINITEMYDKVLAFVFK